LQLGLGALLGLGAVSATADCVVNPGVNAGQIILPTGCGKTTVMSLVAIRAYKRGELKCLVILSPFIILSAQLLRSIAKDFLDAGIAPVLANFNSGFVNVKAITGTDKNGNSTTLEKDLLIFQELVRKATINYSINTKVTSTMDIETIVDLYNDTIAKPNTVLIISSTYHSAHRLLDERLNIDIVMCDEAHNLVTRLKWQSIVHRLGSKRIFFTATPKPHKGACGMDNTAAFGKILYHKSIRRMVEKGEMLPYRIHWVYGKGLDPDSQNAGESYADFIIKTFMKHDAILGLDNNGQAGQILFTLPDRKVLHNVLCSVKFKEFRAEHPEIYLGGICSTEHTEKDGDRGGIWFNGSSTPERSGTAKKEKWLLQVQEIKAGTRAIILHVDMIAEGIDIPSLTAVCPMRTMSDLKKTQTYGRASRLDKYEKIAWYKGTLKREFFKKKNAWLIIPSVGMTTSAVQAEHEDLINFLRTKYNVKIAEAIFDEDGGLPLGKPGPGPINPPDPKAKIAMTALRQYIDILESKTIASVSNGTIMHNLMSLAILSELYNIQMVPNTQ